MHPDDFIVLRRESAAFLAKINDLPGFTTKLAALQCPPRIENWSWSAVRRVVAVLPSTDGYALTPGLVRWLDDEDGDRTPVSEPGLDAAGTALAETYRAAVERFAKRYLLGPTWGARAVHEAARYGTSVRLPRSRPDRLIRLKRAAITYSEIAALEQAHRPRRQLYGNREAAWQGAIEAVHARLNSHAVGVTNRQHARQARRYLEAAVERDLPSAVRAPNPVDPIDDPLWEINADQRIANAKRTQN